MDKLIVFIIVALAVGYVLRRIFRGKGNSCGCGCSGCGGGRGTTGQGTGTCPTPGQKPGY